MKIITKKSVIFTALAVVLLATVLVISCNTPQLDGVSDKEEPSKPGTGKVRLSIDTRNASRTILPVAGSLTDLKYLLVLTGTSSPPLPNFYATVTTSTTSVPDIPVGSYTAATVYVYTGTTLTSANWTNYANVAIGKGDSNLSGPFGINASTPTAIGTFAIVLYSPGTAPTTVGTGTFAYNFTKSSTLLNTAKYSVEGRGSEGAFIPTATPVDVVFGSKQVVGNGTTTNIPSGYYNVVYTLTDTFNRTAYFYEILHIYKGLESYYEKIFTNDIFPDAPSVGIGNTISISGPDVPAPISGNLNSSHAQVQVTTNNYGWNVKILKASVNADFTFTVSAGTTIGSWKLLPALTTITASGGITLDNTTDPLELVITINATGTVTPLVKTGAINYTGLELSFGGKDYTPPAINIQFVDTF